jgi:ribosomal subunit interface protein
VIERETTTPMDIRVLSKGIDFSDALKERLEVRLTDAMSKYMHRPGEAFVTVGREGFGFEVECTVHLPTGAHLTAKGHAADAYAAAEDAVEHVEKRLRRYKRRLVNRRTSGGKDTARLVVFEAPAAGGADVDDGAFEDGLGAADLGETGEGGADPVVIAERAAELPHMSVAMAVEELGLTDAPVVMFRSAVHGGLNVVYRRPDGCIGWIDPGRPSPG